MVVPGSKSETNRALVLAALATGPSVITNGLDSRDTRLMRDALTALGARIEESTDHGTVRWTVHPPDQLTAGADVACGLAGTVMRFVPPVAALAAGEVHFDGDEQARVRPMDVLLDALVALGADVVSTGADSAVRGLPFTVTGRHPLPGGVVTVDASSSSQFVSGLLLAGARYAAGVDVRHDGTAIPSLPHIEMTVAMLRARGVRVDDREAHRWVVTPGAIAPLDVTVEPDLSNAAPFLAAAAVTGGEIRVPNWPHHTHQAGDQIRAILTELGAEVTLRADGLVVQGTGELHGVDLDLHAASELTPVVAAVALFADGTTHLRGVAHIRGHETDRLAALEAELTALGGDVEQTADGLRIKPRLLHSNPFRTYGDHRMAHAAAVVGLVVDDVELDDVGCTDKTMPEFVALWTDMLAQTETVLDEEVAEVEQSERGRAIKHEPGREREQA